MRNSLRMPGKQNIMKQLSFYFILTLIIVMLLAACGNMPSAADEPPQILQETPVNSTSEQDTETDTSQLQDSTSDSMPHLPEDIDEEHEMLKIKIGDTILTAALENNSSVDALKDLLADNQITIDVQNYGGFEKVGTLPQSLPQNDVQMTAVSGDIMLYQGNSIVIFYGSNSWTYTKLGTITGFSQEELSEILSGNDRTVELSIYSN